MTYSTAEEIRFIDGMSRTRDELRRKGTRFSPAFLDELTLLKRYLHNFSTLRSQYGQINRGEVIKQLKEKIKGLERTQAK